MTGLDCVDFGLSLCYSEKDGQGSWWVSVSREEEIYAQSHHLPVCCQPMLIVTGIGVCYNQLLGAKGTV